jgi:predicted AAA+ superfamily ATPase
MQYFKRQRYLDKIIPFVGKPLVKVLLGQRRVGKSYVMTQLIDELRTLHPNAQIIYINKEWDEFGHIQNNDDLLGYVMGKVKEGVINFLLVDEVQEIRDFEKAVRHLLAKETCDIYLTGSNATVLSGELATFLSGRYVTIEVYGLDFKEFLQFHRLEATFESLQLYVKFGGMPFLHHLVLDGNAPFEYLKNVYSTILLKDVVAREGIRNVFLLENLVSFLGDNIGSLLSANNIHKFLKSQKINLSVPVIINYLHALTNAFVVHKVPRSEVGGLKIFEVGEKYYFEDLGLRNTIIGYNPAKDLHKLLENLVYLHLKRLGYIVFVGKLGDKEVDFAAEKEGLKLYVQVTLTLGSENTKQRELGNLQLIGDNYPKYVVTWNDPYSQGDWEGIIQLNILDFLSKVGY